MDDSTGRLLSLWDRLGLRRTHVATQMAGDVAGLAQSAPDRIGSLVLCTPSRLDPEPFGGIADRVVLIAGAQGLTASVTQQAQDRLPGATRTVLAGYDAPGWADVVADRTAEVLAVFDALPSLPPADLPSGSGSHAGITYSIQGSGPPLVLLPFFLAPSQWTPAIPALATRWTVITLGGRHLGGVAALEDRAAGASYRGMVKGLWEAMEVRPDDQVLDVGCGSGALDRLLAAGLSDRGRIVATDLNRFLLQEAAALAHEDGHGARISFEFADAEALPFPEGRFDRAFSVTVLEECDADQALGELFRVLRPNGRAGVIVRSIDMPQWWNLDLPPAIAAKVVVPPQSVGPRGVADATLYPRMQAAGFRDLRCWPDLVTFDNPDGPIWRYREDHALSLLSDTERLIWRERTARARAAGLLFMAHPMHCVVGTKPAVARGGEPG